MKKGGDRGLRLGTAGHVSTLLGRALSGRTRRVVQALEEAHMYLAPYKDLRLSIWLSGNILHLSVTFRLSKITLLYRDESTVTARKEPPQYEPTPPASVPTHLIA